MRQNNVSFRTRNLDVNRTMRIFYPEDSLELTDLPNTPSSMPQIATGMEKEEETEFHLIQAMNTQFLVGNTIETKTIPTPRFLETRGVSLRSFEMPTHYIKYDIFRVEQELPNYDADESDSEWLRQTFLKQKNTDIVNESFPKNTDYSESTFSHIILDFESQIDHCEKIYEILVSQFKNGSLDSLSHPLLASEKNDIMNSAIARLKRDLREIDDVSKRNFADLCIDRWAHLRDKIENICSRLKPAVICDREEFSLHPSAISDPYVAFRRRTERMLTRKNRKNEEIALQKIFRVLYTLQCSQFLLSKIVERENMKRTYQQSLMQTFKQRLLMKDYRCRVVCRCISSILLHFRLKSDLDGNNAAFSRLLLGTGLTNTLAEIDHSHLRWQSYLDAQQDFRTIAKNVLRNQTYHPLSEMLPQHNDCKKSRKIDSSVLLRGFNTRMIPKIVKCRKFQTSRFTADLGIHLQSQSSDIENFDGFSKLPYSQYIHSTSGTNISPDACLVSSKNITSESSSSLSPCDIVPNYHLIRCRYGRGGRILFQGSRSVSLWLNPHSSDQKKYSNSPTWTYELPKTADSQICRMYVPALDKNIHTSNIEDAKDLAGHQHLSIETKLPASLSICSPSISPEWDNIPHETIITSGLVTSGESYISSISGEVTPPTCHNSPGTLKTTTSVLFNGTNDMSVT